MLPGIMKRVREKENPKDESREQKEGEKRHLQKK